jgi:hypothetical protein
MSEPQYLLYENSQGTHLAEIQIVREIALTWQTEVDTAATLEADGYQCLGDLLPETVIVAEDCWWGDWSAELWIYATDWAQWQAAAQQKGTDHA